MYLTVLYLAIVSMLDVVIYETEALRVRRIVGGTAAAEFEFPYQVSLRYYNLHICSGVLISDKHVLSAAHCICGLMDEPSEELRVRTGSVDSSSNVKSGEVHTVKDVKCHPAYVYGLEESWVADLVVVTLSERICVSTSQSPIALATFDPPVGQRAVISGWGQHSSRSWMSRYLQKFSVPIVSNEACAEYYKNMTSVLTSQICTLERKGVGACKGDSGSPLVYNGTLVGIFSWTKPCGMGFPEVSTRVNYFTDFIQQAMKDD